MSQNLNNGESFIQSDISSELINDPNIERLLSIGDELANIRQTTLTKANLNGL